MVDKPTIVICTYLDHHWHCVILLSWTRVSIHVWGVIKTQSGTYHGLTTSSICPPPPTASVWSIWLAHQHSLIKRMVEELCIMLPIWFSSWIYFKVDQSHILSLYLGPNIFIATVPKNSIAWQRQLKKKILS